MNAVLEINESSVSQDRQREAQGASCEGQLAWGRLLSEAGARPRPKRVVIIDDEPKVRVLFARVLEKAGYETVTFGDNAAAIRYLNDCDHPVDLLILDLNMPHIDGRYFRDMLKVKHPSAKALIASNYGIDLQKFLVLDADGYYDKSEGIQALKVKIRQVLDP